MKTYTDYKSRCPFCGERDNFVINENDDILCDHCKNIVGTKINSELDVTILCGWNASKNEK